ncbi:MAG TPA: hypothetical protein VJS44_23250 [Pyrinomonadaceae bacterium]|nr:hypothetical protein [Pyrinomonadaceae bacterium]
MDAETIKREALDAILDLQLDSTVSHVTHSGKTWCVQFEGDYGQFCDSFQNQFERDNSPRVIREKIKKHLLGQITQLRNKGGRRTTKKSFDDDGRPNVQELFQEAVSTTARTIGEAIDRTLGFTGAGLEAVGEVAETVTSGAAELIRPERLMRQPTERPTRRRTAQAKESAPKKAAGKTKRGGTAKKAAGKTKRAASTKKAGGKKTGRKK